MPKTIRASIAILSLSLAFAATVAQAPAQTRNAGAPYLVNDLGLGTQISTDSAQYREYRCGPSEQFDGFTWCHKSRQERDRRTTSSLLHSQDGKIAYINRQQVPVFWDGGSEVNDEIRAHARKLGSQPKINRLPRRSGTPEGVMAMWGDVAIEPLDDESIKTLADGRSPRKGFLVDYLGNLVKSAQDGLPVFRITGGAGLIFVASYDQRGRGGFRVTAVDASVLSPPVVAASAPPVTAEAAESAPPVEPTPQGADLQTGLPEANDGRPDAEGNQDTGSIDGVAQVQAVAEATPLTADDVRNEMTRSANERAAVEAEMARLRFAVGVAYSLIVGLLLLLLAVFVRLLFLKRRNRVGDKAPATVVAASRAGMPSSLNTSAAENRLPAMFHTTPNATAKASDDAGAPAATNASDTQIEQTQANGRLSPAVASSGAEEHTSSLSIVPDDVSEQAPAGEVEHPIDEEPINRLTELSKLRARGMLTDSEFSQLKSSIIASVSRNTVQSP